MTKGLQSARAELRAAFLRTIQSLMTALEAKDPYTRGHSVSVVGYAAEIAKALAKPEREIEMLERLSVLHDIGKIGVHDATLSKPSALNPEERHSIQQHPAIGAKILAPLDLSPEELGLIASHHEREDGAGYPQGLDRSKISDLVAIVSVADAYDAMTSHRPYRHAMPASKALAELRRGAGTQFRPEVVEALAIVLEKKGLV
jgi:putative nucleotidyltransferase with HDIG domain